MLGKDSRATTHGGSTDGEEKPTEHICPCCEDGKMILRREVPRGTVHQMMQWTAEDMHQLELDFR